MNTLSRIAAQARRLLHASAISWSSHKAPRLGAALAFYALLSIAPMLIFAIRIAGLVFGDEAAQRELYGHLTELAGPDEATVVQEMIRHLKAAPTSRLATTLGALTLVFGASGVVLELRDSFNTIWDIPPADSANWRDSIWSVLRDRFVAVLVLLGSGFLLLASLIASTAVTALGHYANGLVPQPTRLLAGINSVASVLVITLLFALIFKFVPAIELRWSDVWIGAASTALLFTLGKYLIALYLSGSSIATAFGAAGSLVILIVWIYYSAQVFFFGAIFTKIFATECGSRMVPKPRAGSYSPKTSRLS